MDDRAKYRLLRPLHRGLFDPVYALGIRAGALPGHALLETRGRVTGKATRRPVRFGLDGTTCWIVAVHGDRAGYVRNIASDPRVRILVRRRWRTGTATPVPGDDPRARFRTFGGPFGGWSDAAFARALGTEMLSIRIDLDPQPAPP